MISQEEYNVHLQATRTLPIKVELLNKNNYVIDSLEGISLEGQINVTSDSLIRRTGSVKFILSQPLLPSQQQKLGINNMIRLYTGLENYLGNTFWFCQGTYYIKKVEVDVSSSGKTISLELNDKMYLFENIPLELTTKFDENTPISDVMRLVVTSLGGEDQVSIDTHEYTLPYDLKFTPEQSVLDIIQKLKDLYLNWQAYYNIDGRFIFQKTKNTLNDPIIWDFIDKTDFRIDSQVTSDYNNMKNFVKIIGKTLDDGTTAFAISQNTDVNSPYSIANIGKKALVENNDNYFTSEQCQVYADYQLFKHGNFNEQVTISTVPIYFLDSGMLVNFNSEEDELVGKYCISSLSVDLKYDSKMSITAYRIYQ